MGILDKITRGATVIVLVILTSFFAAGILTFTSMTSPDFLVAMYKMGFWAFWKL